MTTEQDLLDLRARIDERLKLAKEALGTKYLLHPDNMVKKKKVRKEKKPSTVLKQKKV